MKGMEDMKVRCSDLVYCVKSQVLRYFQWVLRYFYRKSVLSYSPWMA